MRALPSGDLTPAFDLLAATRAQPHRRALAVEVLGAAGTAVLPALRAAVRERPDDVNRLLVLGSAQSSAAWVARGAAYAEHTSDDQFRGLVDLTRQARSTLRRAAEADPDDPAPWCAMMPGALGAPEHDDEAAKVFAEAESRVPDVFGVVHRRLQTLAEKWYGSHDEMFAFARARTEALPDGHPLWSLVPVAHIEVHIANLSNGNLLKRFWRAMTYLGKARAEVNAASDRLLAGPDDEPNSLAAHQMFAVFYHEADHDDDQARFAAHLARSGDRAARWPWGYFGEPDVLFTAARAKVAGGS